MDVEDIGYEEDILRNPYSIKNWWFYLDYKQSALPKERYVLYERALHVLPRSYKLWFRYLTERIQTAKQKPVTDPEYEGTNNAFERSLVHMHKMPRIWIEYIKFLTSQRKITQTRRVCDRALRALPITQHKSIWPLYIEFVKGGHVPAETSARVFRRYLKIEPQAVEEYIEYLVQAGRINDAALKMAEAVNDENFVSQRGKSKHDLWKELLELITKNPQKVTSAVLDVENIVRGGLRRFPHEAGRLWVSLADYYVRLSHFEKARDVYEEGMATVAAVRDFTIIFDAYSAYLESLCTAQMETLEALAEDEDEVEDSDEELEQLLADGDSPEESDLGDEQVDMLVARLEDLMERRPLMLNSVLLRQNPHNVAEWHKRVALFKDEPEKAILTYSDAVTTVDPMKATGKPHSLWVSFARYYEQAGDLENARDVFEKATLVHYKSVDDLASVWCSWAEMELRHSRFSRALNVMKRACVAPADGTFYRKSRRQDDSASVQDRLHRSTKLWSFYADLEENLGTLESVKAVYEKMIDLKICTPQIILNYAQLLEENKYFEDSYRVYEKGLAAFTWPHVLPLWSAYLDKFIDRFKGTKLERTRDMFEQALDGIPPEHAKNMFLWYANYEEQFGLARRAMAIYHRACETVPPEDKYSMYVCYITKAADFFGVTKTREIYEAAVQDSKLPPEYVKNICLKYASLERKLGEIDRARGIYTYASQYCNPRVASVFWKTWHDFEVQHGNRDTYREMLRLRRTVQQAFSQTSFASASMVRPGVVRPEMVGAGAEVVGGKRKRPTDAMGQLEADAQLKAEQARAEAETAVASAVAAVGGAVTRDPSNPEEIDIDDMDDDGDTENVDIAQQGVPLAVFGSALQQLDAPTKKIGALERLKNKM